MSPASRVVIAVAILPHAIKAISYPTYPGFDDAFIHLRVAENFALGKGWGVNAFEPINVSSSPLFTLILTAGHFFTSSSIAFGMLLSATATSCAVVLAYLATRTMVARPALALIPPVLFATNVHLWRWNATAMEPTLACATLGLAMSAFLWAKKGQPLRFIAFGIATGMAFLTRYELGLLLPAGALALLAASDRRDELDAKDSRPSDPRAFRPAVFTRRLGCTMLGFVPVALAWLLFSWQVFGTALPTTFFAKASTISMTNTATVRSIVIVLGSSFVGPLLLAAVVLWKVMQRRRMAEMRSLAEPVVLPGVFAILCVAFYAVSVPEFQSAARYLLPVIYALSLVLGGIVARSLDRGEPPSLFASVLPGAALVQVLVMLAINHLAVAPVLRAFEDNYWSASRQAADYLAAAAKPGESVFAVSDIGMLAYYSRDRYRIVDGPGLAAPAMVGRTPAEIFLASNARLVVQQYGEADSTSFPWAADRTYQRVRAFPFGAAGLVSAKDAYSLNVYLRIEK